MSFAACGRALSRWKTASHSSLHKNATYCWITLCYTCVVIVVSKKLISLHVCKSSRTKRQFFGDATTLFKKCTGSPSSKHDNVAHLCSHVSGMRLHCWRSIKHSNVITCIAMKPLTKLCSFQWISWLANFVLVFPDMSLYPHYSTPTMRTSNHFLFHCSHLKVCPHLYDFCRSTSFDSAKWQKSSKCSPWLNFCGPTTFVSACQSTHRSFDYVYYLCNMDWWSM